MKQECQIEDSRQLSRDGWLFGTEIALNDL